MDRLQEEGKLIEEAQDTDLTSTTPRDSESPSDGCVSESEECVAQCEEKNAEPSSYGWYRTNEDSVLSNEPMGYIEYNDFADESDSDDIVDSHRNSNNMNSNRNSNDINCNSDDVVDSHRNSNDVNCNSNDVVDSHRISDDDMNPHNSNDVVDSHRDSFCQLSHLLGSNCSSESALYPSKSEVSGQERSVSDLSQLKNNLATRLCLSMTAWSCQIWAVFSRMTDLLSECLAATVCDLLKKSVQEAKELFRGLIHMKVVPMNEVEGRVRAMRRSQT